MKTVIDIWNQDGREIKRTYNRHQIENELQDIWGSEEYRNFDDWAHNRSEHLQELLKELEAAE
jgi:hypothetical protein